MLPLSLLTDLQSVDLGIPGEAHKMAPTYSVGELLIMRDTLPFVICNINKLNPKITSGIVFISTTTIKFNIMIRCHQSRRGGAYRLEAQCTLKQRFEFHDEKECVSLLSHFRSLTRFGKISF
jgi:hypothetical protein